MIIMEILLMFLAFAGGTYVGIRYGATELEALQAEFAEFKFGATELEALQAEFAELKAKIEAKL